MNPFHHLDFSEVREHYDRREEISQSMRNLFESRRIEQFVHCALGLTDDGTGNYSAHEHGLGPKILEDRAPEEIFALAEELDVCQNPEAIPAIIYKHRIPYLGISVGSEMATMLNPKRFWVGNIRTIWAHLWVRNQFNPKHANEQLEAYRLGDANAEIKYSLWKTLYVDLGPSLGELAERAAAASRSQDVEPGTIPNLWADAVASFGFHFREEE